MWLRPGIAVTVADAALIRPLAWELQYAIGVALKSKNKKIKNKQDLTHSKYYVFDKLKTNSKCDFVRKIIIIIKKLMLK